MSLEEDNSCTFLWKIEYFSVCYQKNGECIFSPRFRVKGFDGEFHLELYPRGRCENCKDFISCFLWCNIFDQSKYSTNVNMTLAMLDGNDRVLKDVFNYKGTFKDMHNFGNERFNAISELQMKDWKNDAITIRCQMNISYPKKLLSVKEYKALTSIKVDKSCAEWDIKTPILLPMSESIIMSISRSYSLKVTFAPMDLIFRIQHKTFNRPLPQRISFKIIVFNKMGDELSSYRASHLFLHTDLTLSQFFTQQLMECCKIDSSYYEFKLKLEIYVADGKEESSYDFHPSECLRFKSPDNLKNISSEMLNDFRNLYKDKTFCDITIKTKTGMLHAHRHVLQFRSPVFAAMFDHEMQEKRSGILEAVDLDLKTVEDLLEFLYTEAVDKLDYSRAMNLLMVADRYQVQSLIDACVSFFKSVMSPENVCEIFQFADFLNCESLKTNAFCFIRANAAKVLTTSIWFQWMEENKELARYIMEKLSTDFAKVNVV